MSRKNSRTSRNQQEELINDLESKPAVFKKLKEPLTAKTESQKRYINSIKNFHLTFATGPAGCGKTFVAAALAAEMLDSGDVDKIILTRPAVEAGESLGFLPGMLEEKFDPYMWPFRDVLNKQLGSKSRVDYLIKHGVIEASPLAYIRGRTFRNAFVILDEAQNTTPTQMKMFLTRIGEDSRIVVNGDISQKDIPGISGLEDALKRVLWIPEVKLVEFKREDIVRSGLVGKIVQAYDKKS